MTTTGNGNWHTHHTKEKLIEEMLGWLKEYHGYTKEEIYKMRWQQLRKERSMAHGRMQLKKQGFVC